MGSLLTCFGVQVGLRTNEAELWPRIVDCLPACSRQLPGRTVPVLFSLYFGPQSERRGFRPMHLLYTNSARRVRSPDKDDVLVRFERLLRMVLAQSSTRRTFLRATGVRHGDRRLLILRARERSDTSLQDHLIRAGGVRFTYDYAPLDQRGKVEWLVPRREESAEPKAEPIDLVVLPGAPTPGRGELEDIGRAFATVEIVRCAVGRKVPAESQLSSISALARKARVVRPTGSDPAANAASVLRLAGQGDTADDQLVTA